MDKIVQLFHNKDLSIIIPEFSKILRFLDK